MIVLTSDNGMLWGEHRLRGKGNGFEEAIRVPFVVRDDALIATPRKSEDLVLNIDIAPTVAALAGVEAPGVEGASLQPLLEKENPPWRTDFLVEHFSPGGPNGHPPTFCAVRTRHWMYIDSFWGKDELYDVQADPYELRNRIDDPGLAAVLHELQAREAQLCQPPPPRKEDELAPIG
jgi:arylsulfatase A-like enzyme